MFQGFDDTTVDFLWGIRLNNERPWFEAHKQEYLDHLYQPMKALGDELYDHMAPQLKGEPLLCKVSRIYRDARRLHGRGPYKDHLWISIQKPAGAWEEAPCFWFELSPDGWGYGMGCYSVKPATMARLRRQLQGVRGALTGKAGETRLLALPYDGKKPLPLAPLFCLARLRDIGGKRYVVYAFDEKEWPVFH